MEIRKAMRIARRASLAYFHLWRFAGRYRRKRRHSAAPNDPVPMFSRDRPARSTAPSRPAICRRNTSAFSKRPSAILLLVEIIQFVAVNAHNEPQHTVDQRCKPCCVVSQQVEDCRHFALGLGADIDRRRLRQSTGAKNVRSKSGSVSFLRRNPNASSPAATAAGTTDGDDSSTSDFGTGS